MIVTVLKESTSVPDQLAYASTRGWYVASNPDAHADCLLTILEGRVVGAYQVLSFRYTGFGRVRFELEPSSRLAFMLGKPVPFGICVDPDFALCVGTELVLEPYHGRRQPLSRRSIAQAAVVPLRPRPARERPRVAGSPIDAVDD